ncbi:MAG: hypothetical protein IH944_05715 [Armatimonadetes bacterium]|nr:hypothetical protein [Armatimonadota bacterium]
MRFVIRCLSIAGLSVAAIYVPAQAGDETNRIDVIMSYVEGRAADEADAAFNRGDFPQATQVLRFRNRVLPNYELVATELFWMLLSVQYYDEMLATGKRLRLENPTNPDAGLPEAEFFWQRKLYARIPPILEPMLTVGKTPHANTFRVLAHAYSKLGFHADSVRVWKKYLEIAPDDAAAKRNLSRARDKVRGK